MKPATFLLILTCLGTSTVRAGVEVPLSVKFIFSSTGVGPATVVGGSNIDLSTATAFDTEVAHGNKVLDSAARGYSVKVVEYLNIQPAAPSGQDVNYWYNLDAREERQTIESAAMADTATWKWNTTGAINIYINNSSSGSCSFIGDGVSISLGATIFTRGTVLHEIGHFFNLRHTHMSDPDRTGWVPPNPLSSGLGDGDGIPGTLPDHPFYTIDQLSFGNYGANYADLDDGERAAIDATWNNLMSYHAEERLLPIQMDIWAENGNVGRRPYTIGTTWFVSPAGNDGAGRGWGYNFALATLPAALTRVTSEKDVITLRTANYTAPATITARCTLTAAHGAVTLTRP